MKKVIIIIAAIFILKYGLEVKASETYDVFSGGFASCKSLTWNTVDGEYNYEAIESIAQWNGVSSKVKITKSKKVPNANILLSIGKVDSPKSGQLGLTSYYLNKKNVNNDKVWDKAICVRYNNNYDYRAHYATTVHEIGHALSLAHCTAEALHKDPHIMHQGVKTKYTPTGYDKKKLKYKWGN
ncbi:MAG: hypothetical protein K6G76_00905 [Lachnospiraceae bacterium]|nr:hypothetical protein [Lachnospiraceae bacterium]